MISKEEIRELALSRKKMKVIGAPTKKLVASVPEEWVQTCLDDLEKHIYVFANDGQMFFDYMFKDVPNPIGAMQVIAVRFKERHPELMVISSPGELKLIISWDDNNV